LRTILRGYYKKLKKKYADKVYKKKQPYFKNFHRVYHVHIRKSAGTSINSAFWGVAGLNLKQVKRWPLLLKNDYIFVRNNKEFIEDGRYFYGNSHIPFWSLRIPKNTFTFCMLRDPYERLLSLYRYYKWVADLNPQKALGEEPYYNTLIKQIHWLGDSFSDFIDNLPNKHLQNQLFMFSENFNHEEAFININKLNKIYFQNNFEEAINDLKLITGLELSVRKERSFGKKIELEITAVEEQKAKDKLADEYIFYNKIIQQCIVVSQSN
jgi:hypothetical protein